MDKDNRKERTAQGGKSEGKRFGKPAFGAKRDGKPAGNRRFDKPFGEKRADRPAGDRHFDPRTEKKTDKPDNRHFDPRTEKRPERPVTEKKSDRPAGEKNFNRAPRTNAPREQKPVKPVYTIDARGAALIALNEVYSSEAYTNLALDRQLKKLNLSDEDKRLATNIFYQCVENRTQIEYILAPFVKEEPEIAVKCMLHVACAQIFYLDRIPNHAAVNEAVNQTKAFKHPEATGFVNGVLRSLLRAMEAGEVKLPEEADDPEKYLSIKYSVSMDLIKLLEEAYGYETAKQIVSYRHSEHYETGRPNLLRTDNAGFEKYLNDNGIEWKYGKVPGSYRLSRAGNPAQNPDYLRGLFSLQGESAMLAALAVEPKHGMSILDACAAPGGKSAYMCELMQGSGRVYAWDLHEHRADLIKSNGKRLGLDNLRAAAKDATLYRPELEKSFDAVLIDAPCSGVGVIADKPDIKYSVTAEKVHEIAQTQKKILAACSQYVKKGGMLVYATCSILPEENEKQVKEFLLENPDFRIETGDSYLPEEFRPLVKDGMLTLQQYRDDVEGFFIARMRRV